jgi:Amino acid synthesis
MDIRRLQVVKDMVYAEGGLPSIVPVTRVAACAVIFNPLAGRALDNLQDLVPFGAELGQLLVQEALKSLTHRRSPMARQRSSVCPEISSMRRQSCTRAWASRCGTRSVAARPSFRPTSKSARWAAASIFRLATRTMSGRFDQIDTLSIAVGNAPRPDEIVVIVALADGGRPRPRVSKAGAVTPRTSR